jgi:hypothetical protein
MRLSQRRPNEAVERVLVQVSYPPAHPLSSNLWQLSRGLADVGLLILLLTTLLALVANHSSLGSTVACWIPGPIRAVFHSEGVKAADWGAAQTPELARNFDRVVPPPRASRASSRPSAAFFGIGSSRDEVRALQGPPTEAEGNVWKYGKSEVHFLQGRVVSWVNDPANPLRVR